MFKFLLVFCIVALGVTAEVLVADAPPPPPARDDDFAQRKLQSPTSGGSGTCSSRGAGTYPYVPNAAVALSFTYIPSGSTTSKTITTSLYGYEFQSARCGYNWMVTTNSQQADYFPLVNPGGGLITFSQCSMASERSYLQCVQSSGYGNVGSTYGQDGQTCMPTSGSGSTVFNTQSYCSQRSAYQAFCCYCPDGKYAPTGSVMVGESNCASCPPGSFMGYSLQQSTSGQSCLPCPAGTYQDTSGATTDCTACPAGKSTFTQNQYTSSGNTYSFVVGATSVDQCVAVDKMVCTAPPCSYLAKDMISTTVNGLDYAPGGYSYAFRYLSACPNFGYVLAAASTASLVCTDPGASSSCTGNQNSKETDCQVCPGTQPYFYAGGQSYSRQINNYYTGFSSQLSQYVYGTQMFSSQKVTTSEGGTIYLNYFTDVQSPVCVEMCPAGSGPSKTADEVKTCINCESELGQYNPTAGSECTLCPRNSYAASDRATSCTKCPYPYISDWNQETAKKRPPAGMPDYEITKYAKDVLQYRSCKNNNNWAGSRALCLCLPTGQMLAVILPITAFFVVLLTFFISAAIGCKGCSAKQPPSHNPVQQADMIETTPPSADMIEMVDVDTKLPAEGSSAKDKDRESSFVDVSSAKDKDRESSFVDVGEDPSGDPLGRAQHKPVLIGWRVMVGILAYVLVPFIDNMTDLAFILSNPFYNVGLFVAMVVAYCLPALMLFQTLIDKKAAPKFYLVPMPQRFLFAEYNSLWKIVVGTMTLIPFIILNSPVLLPWLMLGCLLYTTKAFAIRPVANLWMHVYDGSYFAAEGSPAWEKRRKDIELAEWHPIDERVLNESLMAHILLETFPIVAIQFINNQLYRKWDGLAVFSMVFSIFNSFSGVYRIGYYRLYLKIPLRDVPVDFTIFGVNVFGSETIKVLTAEETASGGGARHRFSFQRSADGTHTTVQDEWVDSTGHVHHDDVKAPLLEHVVGDLLKVTDRVDKLEARVEKLDPTPNPGNVNSK